MHLIIFTIDIRFQLLDHRRHRFRLHWKLPATTRIWTISYSTTCSTTMEQPAAKLSILIRAWKLLKSRHYVHRNSCVAITIAQCPPYPVSSYIIKDKLSSFICILPRNYQLLLIMVQLICNRFATYLLN